MFAILGYRSELYDAGPTEEGGEYHAERYVVVGEFADGRRFAHAHSFDGCNVIRHDEGTVSFVDVREKARMQAERLIEQIGEAGEVDLDGHWFEIPAAYGSAAMQRDELRRLPRRA